MPDLRTFELWDAKNKEKIEVEAKHLSKDEWAAICPRHGDTVPSLHINPQKGVYHCKGCDFNGRLYDPSYTQRSPSPHISLSEKAREFLKAHGHDYTEDTLKYFGIRSRIHRGKEYIWYSYQDVSRYIDLSKPDAKRKWTSKKGDKVRLIGDFSSSRVILCEGEHDMFMAYQKGVRGYAAFTGGAQTLPKDRKELERLRNKEVIIIYDIDDPGINGSERVAKGLEGIAKKIKIIRLPLDGKGKDLTDYLNSDHTVADLEALIQKTPFHGEVDHAQRLTDIGGSCSLEEVRTTFKRWLYLEEPEIIDVVLAVIKGNEFGGDPLWLLLVSPPGSTKTEILRSLNNHYTYSVSTLSEHSLISGMGLGDGRPDPSLIPKLDGKNLIVKDFTTILSMRRESRQVILGDLRDAYDGEICKTFGTGERRYKSRFGLIAGVVPIVENYTAVTQSLGDRFLMYRHDTGDVSVTTRRALRNIGKEKGMRKEMQNVIERFLLSHPIYDIELDQITEEFLVNLACFTAVMRTQVSRDGYNREINFIPLAEVPTRLGKQFKALLLGLLVVRGKQYPDEQELDILRKVATDTIPSKRVAIIKVLYEYEDDRFLTTQEIGDETDLPTSTCKIELDDMRLLKIVERQGTNTFTWSLTSEFRHRISLLKNSINEPPVITDEMPKVQNKNGLFA